MFIKTITFCCTLTFKHPVFDPYICESYTYGYTCLLLKMYNSILIYYLSYGEVNYLLHCCHVVRVL